MNSAKLRELTLLSLDPVHRTLDVALSLSGLDLGFSLGVTFFTVGGELRGFSGSSDGLVLWLVGEGTENRFEVVVRYDIT